METELSEGAGAKEKTLDCFTEQPFPNMISAQHAMIQAFPRLKIRKNVGGQMGFKSYRQSIFPVNFQDLKGLANC